jgi:hypothetical protein
MFSLFIRHIILLSVLFGMKVQSDGGFANALGIILLLEFLLAVAVASVSVWNTRILDASQFSHQILVVGLNKNRSKHITHTMRLRLV